MSLFLFVMVGKHVLASLACDLLRSHWVWLVAVRGLRFWSSSLQGEHGNVKRFSMLLSFVSIQAFVQICDWSSATISNVNAHPFVLGLLQAQPATAVRCPWCFEANISNAFSRTVRYELKVLVDFIRDHTECQKCTRVRPSKYPGAI